MQLLWKHKKKNSLKAVNDTVKRAVKLKQDFQRKITAKEEQKQYLLRCVQEHRKLYPDCKKQTLTLCLLMVTPVTTSHFSS